MIEPPSKITIPEKRCGINQVQMDWLRLLISSISSKVASLKITSIWSRPMTRDVTVLKSWNCLEKVMAKLTVWRSRPSNPDPLPEFLKLDIAWNEVLASTWEKLPVWRSCPPYIHPWLEFLKPDITWNKATILTYKKLERSCQFEGHV